MSDAIDQRDLLFELLFEQYRRLRTAYVQLQEITHSQRRQPADTKRLKRAEQQIVAYFEQMDGIFAERALRVAPDINVTPHDTPR